MKLKHLLLLICETNIVSEYEKILYLIAGIVCGGLLASKILINNKPLENKPVENKPFEYTTSNMNWKDNDWDNIIKNNKNDSNLYKSFIEYLQTTKENLNSLFNKVKNYPDKKNFTYEKNPTQANKISYIITYINTYISKHSNISEKNFKDYIDNIIIIMQ